MIGEFRKHVFRRQFQNATQVIGTDIALARILVTYYSYFTKLLTTLTLPNSLLLISLNTFVTFLFFILSILNGFDSTLFLLTEYEGYAAFIVSSESCLERFPVLTLEA